MAYEFIRYEKKDHIAYMTINRPEVMNALHPFANEELSDAWTDFARDDESWVAILTGAGERAFSAGNDLKYTAAQSSQSGGRTQPPRPPIVGGFGGLTNRYDIWKPIIAAVNGYALGGGFEIAMACDIIIAAEHAQFGLPEPRRGLMASAGGVHRLPRQVPLKVAMGMMLTGKPITAQRAYELGLVNEIVPLKDLMLTAERWAQEIMECAPLSVRASKQASIIGLDLPLEHAINRSYFFYQLLQTSDDFREGPRAFAEKRKPEWKGK